ncbi:MAG: hypothetical protein IPM34_05345 [Saprospiraceae bacterium]|nr:hypothetical protein [Saprospiraceae bacterium]
MQFIDCKKGIMVILILGITMIVFGQPNWTVDPAKYEFTMTLTGIGIIQCKETNDKRDMIAAFVGEEVRGVQFFDGENNGRNYAYLTIYDSVFSGSQVKFKLYDASQDRILDVWPQIVFLENQNIGNDLDPFILETSADTILTFVSNERLLWSANVGDTIAEVFSLNQEGDTINCEYQFVNDSLGEHNSFFMLEENYLILNKKLEQGQGYDKLKLHISGISKYGCKTEQQLILPIFETVNNRDEEYNRMEDLIVYPNPTSGYLCIDPDLHLDELQLINPINGKIHILNLNAKNSVDVSDFPSQMYYLVGRKGGVVFREALIKL